MIDDFYVSKELKKKYIEIIECNEDKINQKLIFIYYSICGIKLRGFNGSGPIRGTI